MGAHIDLRSKVSSRNQGHPPDHHPICVLQNKTACSRAKDPTHASALNFGSKFRSYVGGAIDISRALGACINEHASRIMALIEIDHSASASQRKNDQTIDLTALEVDLRANIQGEV